MVIEDRCKTCFFSKRYIRYNSRYKRSEVNYYCSHYYKNIKLLRSKCSGYRDINVPDIGKLIKKEGFNRFSE